jgi:predicted AAA+ superfamily ATPase
VTAGNPRSLSAVTSDAQWRGHLVENAVGAALLQEYDSPGSGLSYWRDGSLEADFVLSEGASITAIEVKSGRPGKISGLAAFKKKYPKSSPLVIGSRRHPVGRVFRKS